MKTILRIFINWLPFAIITTGFCALVYGAVQQNFRMSANDPQIQITRDIINEIENGVKPEEIVPESKTNLESSLSPYIIFYDGNGKAVASSAELDSKTPVPPKGSFDYAKSKSENRFTWEPKHKVRQASILVYNKKTDSFVLAARSLKEIEKREDALLQYTIAVYAVTMIFTLIVVGLKTWKNFN